MNIKMTCRIAFGAAMKLTTKSRPFRKHGWNFDDVINSVCSIVEIPVCIDTSVVDISIAVVSSMI